ncbi:hypothetical protein Tco_1101523 [Tanacetum coccineum]
MNYVPIIEENRTNGIAGKRDNIVAGQAKKKIEPEQEYILIPICTTDPLISQEPKVSEEDAKEKPTEMDESGASNKDGKDDQATRSEFERLLQQEKHIVHPNSTNSINTVSTPVSTAGPSCTDDDLSSPVNDAKASNAFEEHLFENFLLSKMHLHFHLDFDVLDDAMKDVDATPVTPPTTTTVFDDDEDLTIAQTLVMIRNKGKGILRETESMEKTKNKVQGDTQIELDAKVALRFQAELDEKLRVERERQEEASKVDIAEIFDEVHARMDVDYELAARMTQ